MAFSSPLASAAARMSTEMLRRLRWQTGRGTPVAVTTGTGPDTSQDHAGTFAEAWEAIRADQSIQFAPVEQPPPPEPPAWLQALGRFLKQLLQPVAELLGLSWPVFKWMLLALAVVAAAALLWRLLAPIARIGKSPSVEAQPDWTPDRAEAEALLEDADRLAAEGRFDEATHLLLRRSVGQIALARPGWLEPSSTAREIASLSALPDAARTAFAIIAERVERSLFALRPLGEQDWSIARAAYSDFALTNLGPSA